ncbi:MAG: hypothetical protein IKM73_14720 [Acidaminococcaceae bacterium]|nr:hypothetical protein [Acidaminococcaceae bacterium]
MTSRRIQRSIRALVRNECPYYRAGICMETGKYCPARYVKQNEPVDRLLDCDQFLKCVLPAGWDMDDLIDYTLWYDDSGD